jgi:hypothetical protein
MRRFGFINPLLVDETRKLIAGHGRLLAAKRLGLDRVPVIEISGLSESEKRALVIADNRIAEGSGWDFDLLHSELSDLARLGFDVEITGFDLDSLPGLDPEPETFDEVSEELPGAKALKDEIRIDSTLRYGIPELRADMLAEIPANLRSWAGPDATPDDGVSTWLWQYRSDGIRGLPRDRFVGAFYVDDYRFEPVFANPAKYATKLLNMGARILISPNFSIWVGQPSAAGIWSTYRARYIARYFQEAGIAIIPDVNFSDADSFDYCLLGIPKNAPAIAFQVQTVADDDEMARCVYGIERSVAELEPRSVLVYGGPKTHEILKRCRLSVPVVFIENRAAARRKVLEDRS